MEIPRGVPRTLWRGLSSPSRYASTSCLSVFLFSPFTHINVVPLSVALCKRLSILVPSHLLGPRVISICTPVPGKETHFSPFSPRSLRIGAACVVYLVFLRYSNVWISVLCLHDKKVLRLLFILFSCTKGTVEE